MSVFVSLVSEGYKVQPRNLPEKPELITTQELSERCEKAAQAWGPSFFEHLNKSEGGHNVGICE